MVPPTQAGLRLTPFVSVPLCSTAVQPPKTLRTNPPESLQEGADGTVELHLAEFHGVHVGVHDLGVTGRVVVEYSWEGRSVVRVCRTRVAPCQPATAPL